MRYFTTRYGRLLGWALLLCGLLLWTAGCRARSPETEITAPPESEITAPPEDMAPPPLTLPPSSADTRPIPVLSVVTEGEALILSRAQYIKATLTVYPTADSSSEENITLPCSIRGRGHSSFQYSEDLTDYKSKNSYRVKLEESAALLPHREGERDRDWVLISCKNDASALRNHLVWDLARRMGTLPYVTDYTWVELYLNGDYRGLYLLTEQIEVDGDRVDIDDRASTDPAEVGYLLEYDFRGDIESNAREGLTYFYLPDSNREVEWVIKSRVYTKAETAAIRDHLLACHEAILSGDRARMEELIDLPSFVDMFILQELSKNPDVGVSSFYAQRDAGGKLCLTAPWDFDFSFGTYSTGVSTLGLVTSGDKVPPHPWFAALMEQAWFVEEVLSRMEEIQPLMEQTLTATESLAAVLTPASDRNHSRWGIYGAKYTKYVNDQVSVKLQSYEEHVAFLTRWTRLRFTRMEQALRREKG
ncbi:MAG: CotH kinase family protein [Clostridia bacterium]|nr:CotH kinase family protein [Clostridia bacterium]